MAVALRSSSSVAGGSRTNTTVTAPSGITNDDILVCHMYNEIGVNGITPPAGWAEWSDRTNNPTNTWYTQTFWKRAASESGNYTFTHSSTWSAAAMLCFSGALASGDPLDASFVYTQGVDASPQAGSITNSQANSMNMIGHTDYNTGLTVTAGSSGYTVAVSVSLIAALYAVQAASGASGTKDYTATGSSQNATGHWSIKVASTVTDLPKTLSDDVNTPWTDVTTRNIGHLKTLSDNLDNVADSATVIAQGLSTDISKSFIDDINHTCYQGGEW